MPNYSESFASNALAESKDERLTRKKIDQRRRKVENTRKLQAKQQPVPKQKVGPRTLKHLAAKKSANRAKRAWKVTEFRRKYHSLERRQFVSDLPCFATGVRGGNDNAHVCDPTDTKGMGRKASYLGIAPLAPAAHRLLHDQPAKFRAKYGEFDWAACARWTEERWLEHSAETPHGSEFKP